MTKFLNEKFSTYAPVDRRYADNWERTFGKMKPAPVPEPTEEPVPDTVRDPPQSA